MVSISSSIYYNINIPEEVFMNEELLPNVIVETHLELNGVKLQDGFYKIRDLFVGPEFLEFCDQGGISAVKKREWYFVTTDNVPI